MKMSDEKKLTIRELIDAAVADGAFPCASIIAGTPYEILFEYYTGNRSIYPKTAPLDNNTLFDIASLTKVLATVPLAMMFIDTGRISLADKVTEYLPEFLTNSGREIKLGQLLTHTAGCTPHLPLFDMCCNYEDAISMIAKDGILHTPGAQVLYSDLGFIIMGRVLEITGKDTLDNLFMKYLYQPLDMHNTSFRPLSDNIALTEKDPKTGSYLNGVVHDENAKFFGGVSGHAGLFSNAADISKFAVMLLRYGKACMKQIISEASVRAMTRNYTYRLGEDRGLGWSLKAERIPGTDSYSSAGGDLATPGSYGHTGFTGTSIWLDNTLGVYIICLTNRVHYGRENVKIIRFRRLLHNMFFASLEY